MNRLTEDMPDAEVESFQSILQTHPVHVPAQRTAAGLHHVSCPLTRPAFRRTPVPGRLRRVALRHDDAQHLPPPRSCRRLHHVVRRTGTGSGSGSASAACVLRLQHSGGHCTSDEQATGLSGGRRRLRPERGAGSGVGADPVRGFGSGFAVRWTGAASPDGRRSGRALVLHSGCAGKFAVPQKRDRRR